MYSDLATEVSANATALRQLIAGLLAEQEQLRASINQTNSVVEDAESALQQVSYYVFWARGRVTRRAKFISYTSNIIHWAILQCLRVHV